MQVTKQGWVVLNAEGKVATLFDYPRFLDDEETENLFTTNEDDARRRAEYLNEEQASGHRVAEATLTVNGAKPLPRDIL